MSTADAVTVPFLIKSADFVPSEVESQEAADEVAAHEETIGPFHTRCGHPRSRDD